MSNVYTNKMRYAVRTLKNPTHLEVLIRQNEDHLELVVDISEFNKLPMAKKLDFTAYVFNMQDILESEGATVNIPRFV